METNTIVKMVTLTGTPVTLNNYNAYTVKHGWGEKKSPVIFVNRTIIVMVNKDLDHYAVQWKTSIGTTKRTYTLSFKDGVLAPSTGGVEFPIKEGKKWVVETMDGPRSFTTKKAAKACVTGENN